MGWFVNKKAPYLGGGERASRLHGTTVSDAKAGWSNLKSELGKAFDFVTGKKKKKPGEGDGSAG